MIKYITYREPDEVGRLCYFILQKEFPHYLGLLSVGKMDEVLYSAPVAGYNLYINFNGCLHGKFIPSYKDALQEIVVVLDSMADFFYHNRILSEPKKYAKFKIHDNATH